MKKLLLLSLLAFCFAGSAQTTTKQQDIQKLLTALQIKNIMQSMVSNGIELYKKQKPAVPQQVWNDIKKSVDYSSYMTQVAAIFDNNYSQPEIKNLITLAASAPPGKLPQFKKIVQQELYNAGKEFGNNFGNLIKLTLKSKGYL